MKFARFMVIALAATSFLFAQEAAAPAAEAAAPAKTEKAAAKKEAVKTIAGKVISVDAVANTIIVKVKKAEDTISVEATTKIVSGKKEIALGDIKADASVTVSYKVVDGKKVATKISEKAEKAAAKTAKKEAAATEAAPAASEPAAAPAAEPAK
jgi:hypothetical protein